MKTRLAVKDGWTNVAPLAALIAVHATVQAYHLLLSQGLSLSADSAERVVLAYSWARHPTFFIQPSAWLPLFFWIYGTLLKLWPDPLWAPTILTVAVSNLCLLPLYGICRLIGGGREGSLLASCAAAFMPLSLLAAGQPYFDPIFAFFILSGIYAWLRSEDATRSAWHAASVAAMAAAALTRMEGWLFVAAWIALLRRRPGAKLRLLALCPITLCVAHQLLVFGRFEGLRLVRQRGLVIEQPQEWWVAAMVWKWVFADGILVPFVVLGFPALDLKRAAVRETLGLVWLPFLAFVGMVQFMGFPLPLEHLATFLALQMIPLAPALDRALRAWSSSLRAWTPSWDRPARLALACVILLGTAVAAMTRAAPGMTQPVLAPARLVGKLGELLAPGGGRIVLELPIKGFSGQDERFEDPQLLRLKSLPAEMRFDRPFRYAHDPYDRSYILNTPVPSLLDLPETELRRELDRQSVRLVMARSRRAPLERLGWRSAGELRHYLFYARPEEAFFPLLRTRIATARARIAAAK
ncbi:MAG: glycosyltransferase family 39 protein [Elusimicrobia bacterium]|nr:glycosyltransferase family 39 protein [Elusimicrobiota bacterium]